MDSSNSSDLHEKYNPQYLATLFSVFGFIFILLCICMIFVLCRYGCNINRLQDSRHIQN